MNASHDNPGDRKLWRRFAAAGAAKAGRDCPTAADLAAYVEARCDDAGRDRMEAHLAACPRCLGAVREARALLAAGPMLAPVRLVARAKALVPDSAAAARWRWAIRWAATAAAAIVIGLAGFFAGESTYQTRRTTEAAVARTIAFDLGELDGDAVVEEYLLETELAEEGGAQ